MGERQAVPGEGNSSTFVVYAANVEDVTRLHPSRSLGGRILRSHKTRMRPRGTENRLRRRNRVAQRIARIQCSPKAILLSNLSFKMISIQKTSLMCPPMMS